jgi:2,4-dienoyl-CoA reductase (NADPH2)
MPLEPFKLFEPFKIKNVEFGNRVVRSSIGGRMAYYDGRVSPAWVAFEKRFAAGGVAAIISATISINKDRMSPLEYPSIHSDRFVGPLRDAVREVKKAGTGKVECRYIMQIGDTGGHTHTSLFPQPNDALSASSTFDFLYGYCNRTIAMTEAQIEASIAEFAAAARRVVAIGCDGIEVTASKGYLIQQFLNPATNRRRDQYGGSVDNRFRFLSRVVEAVRKGVGPDFLFGVRLSAKDYNYLPINIRLPPVWNLRHYVIGNTLRETTYYAKRLEELGVDYLHVDSGFGSKPERQSRRLPGCRLQDLCQRQPASERQGAGSCHHLQPGPSMVSPPCVRAGVARCRGGQCGLRRGNQAGGQHPRDRQRRFPEKVRDQRCAACRQVRPGGHRAAVAR